VTPSRKHTARQPSLRTSDIAKAVGVHPNTVRLYEVWGFLPPIPRSPKGYRLYTQAHLDQMRLARTALHSAWPGRKIRQSALALVRCGATGDLGGTLECAYHHLAIVQSECAEAEAAAKLLQRWAEGSTADATSEPLSIKQAAKSLGLSTDVLRNWERNGLIRVPREGRNRYRHYGQAEISRLRVIRMLRSAGYSTMAILRMSLQLDQGKKTNLRAALNTPRPDEDVFTAADCWLSTLAEQEKRAREMIAQIEAMLRKEHQSPRTLKRAR